MPLTPPYPTATIYVPWDELEAGLDAGALPDNVALTDGNETFDANLDVTGDLFCGDDLGVVGDIAAGGTLTTAASVVTADGVYEHGRAEAMGEWHDVPYNAGNFTASAGTWTVSALNASVYRYTLIGKTLILAFYIQQTNVSAAPATLYLSLAGFTAATYMRNAIQAIDAANGRAGIAATVAGSGLVSLAPDMAGTAWATTAGNDTYVIGQIAVEIQ